MKDKLPSDTNSIAMKVTEDYLSKKPGDHEVSAFSTRFR